MHRNAIPSKNNGYFLVFVTTGGTILTFFYIANQGLNVNENHLIRSGGCAVEKALGKAKVKREEAKKEEDKRFLLYWTYVVTRF